MRKIIKMKNLMEETVKTKKKQHLYNPSLFHTRLLSRLSTQYLPTKLRKFREQRRNQLFLSIFNSIIQFGPTEFNLNIQLELFKCYPFKKTTYESQLWTRVSGELYLFSEYVIVRRVWGLHDCILRTCGADFDFLHSSGGHSWTPQGPYKRRPHLRGSGPICQLRSTSV